MEPMKLKSGAPQWTQWQRILLFLVLSFLVFSLFFPHQDKESVSISYTKFKAEVGRGQIEEVTFKGSQITGKFKSALTKDLKLPEKGAEVPTYKNFKTTKPPLEDPDLLTLLEKNNVTISAESAEQGSWL